MKLIKKINNNFKIVKIIQVNVIRKTTIVLNTHFTLQECDTQYNL